MRPPSSNYEQYRRDARFVFPATVVWLFLRADEKALISGLDLWIVTTMTTA